MITTCLSAVYIFYEGESRYSATGNYLSFYSQWRPSIFFYTLVLASTFYYFLGKILPAGRHGHLPQSLIKSFSSLSFFVFFVHVIILEIVWNTAGLRFFPQTSGLIVRNLWYDPVFFATVTALSFSLAYLCHKIPFLSKLTG